MSCAVITDPNDGNPRKLLCVLRQGNDSLFKESNNLMNSTDISEMEYEKYATYPDDWILSQFRALGSPWPDLFCGYATFLYTPSGGPERKMLAIGIGMNAKVVRQATKVAVAVTALAT